MLASLSMFAAALLIGALGTVHLVYTFRGTKLHPRDPALHATMRQIAPVISRDMSMWSAWMGFNVSHSLCAILFATVYGYLALWQPAMLFGSVFLLAVAWLLLATLTWVGVKYWFRLPTTGIAIALACCSLSLVATLAGG